MKAAKKFLKSQWKILTFFTVLNFFMFYYAYLRENIYYKQYTALFFTLHLFLEIVLVIIYVVVKNKNWSIEKIFLALFIPIGLTTIFATPLNQIPDELTHITRVDAITDGKIIAQKNENGEYREFISQNVRDTIALTGAETGMYKEIMKNMIKN